MTKTLTASRSSAFERQRGLCCYCDEPMWVSDPEVFAKHHGLTRRQADAHRCTAEHLQARREGGRDVRENIAAACAWCNSHRHAQRAVVPNPDQYRQLV
ncbi:MAG: restriction endonuclease, partial [Alcaligenaceae bacterium]